MAGIYIHIPFCKSKCSYCDFYSVANKTRIPDFIDALLIEIDKNKDQLKDKHIETIYFGGGTPSILNLSDIDRIISKIYTNFDIIPSPEISFEANPDNLTPEYLKGLKNIGINRLSIGIQSLDNEILKFLRRKHSTETALQSIENASNIGFNNISVDLIYGIPGLNNKTWKANLSDLLQFPVQHLSAYHLGIEKNTLMHKQFQNNKFKIVDEEISFNQYVDLVDISAKMGFPQYEISNFAKIGKESKHNSSYWNRTEYIGLGPSAHSYYKQKRSYNTPNLIDYIEGLRQNKNISKSEILTKKDLHNETIMLSLRTIKGLNLTDFENIFGPKSLKSLLSKLENIDKKLYIIQDLKLSLTKSGMFISDTLICELFE